MFKKMQPTVEDIVEYLEDQIDEEEIEDDEIKLYMDYQNDGIQVFYQENNLDLVKEIRSRIRQIWEE